MARYHYAVRSNGQGGVDILTRDEEAAQTLWAWAGDYGSTRDPGAYELYGRKRAAVPGFAWAWTLSPDGVRSLTKSLKLQLAEPKKYGSTAKENACARELLAKLGAGSVSGLGGLSVAQAKRLRLGDRVLFTPNPVSYALYSRKYALPQPGESGKVVDVPIPGGRRTYLPGPGGGLVYVRWDKGGTMGIAPVDLTREAR